jgi:predicted nucleic acid-binding protein
MSPRRYVLDANALVGLFEDREGTAARVERLLQEGQRQNAPLLMSTVTWGEVFYIVWKRHGENQARATQTTVADMPIVFVGVDFDRATRAAALKQNHKLGYADCFAAELAIERGAWLVTADPEFAKVGKALLLYSLPRNGG